MKIKKILDLFEFYGDWGLGIGDWGLGIGPNPQSPIPNPQYPIPIEYNNFFEFIYNLIQKNNFKYC